MGTFWQVIVQDGWQSSKLSRQRRVNGRYLAAKGMRLTAEILEPRCLMTESAVIDGESLTPAADNAGTSVGWDSIPTGLTGRDRVPTYEPTSILVDASLWDDRGLTVLQVDDWVHVVHTGTDIDVISPLPAAERANLILQGRDNVPDVLTLQRYSANLNVQFDGGIGSDSDELHLNTQQDDWQSDPIFEVATSTTFSSVSWEGQWTPKSGNSRCILRAARNAGFSRL